MLPWVVARRDGGGEVCRAVRGEIDVLDLMVVLDRLLRLSRSAVDASSSLVEASMTAGMVFATADLGAQAVVTRRSVPGLPAHGGEKRRLWLLFAAILTMNYRCTII